MLVEIYLLLKPTNINIKKSDQNTFLCISFCTEKTKDEHWLSQGDNVYDYSEKVQICTCIQKSKLFIYLTHTAIWYTLNVYRTQCLYLKCNTNIGFTFLGNCNIRTHQIQTNVSFKGENYNFQLSFQDT